MKKKLVLLFFILMTIITGYMTYTHPAESSLPLDMSFLGYRQGLSSYELWNQQDRTKVGVTLPHTDIQAPFAADFGIDSISQDATETQEVQKQKVWIDPCPGCTERQRVNYLRDEVSRRIRDGFGITEHELMMHDKQDSIYRQKLLNGEIRRPIYED